MSIRTCGLLCAHDGGLIFLGSLELGARLAVFLLRCSRVFHVLLPCLFSLVASSHVWSRESLYGWWIFVNGTVGCRSAESVAAA